MNDPNGHQQLSAKGFGVEISAKGALVILVVLILGMSIGLGYLVWKMGERIEGAIWGTQGPGQIVVDHDRRSIDVQEKMTQALSRLACAQWYTPEEKKAIRLQVERQPALEKLWCP